MKRTSCTWRAGPEIATTGMAMHSTGSTSERVQSVFRLCRLSIYVSLESRMVKRVAAFPAAIRHIPQTQSKRDNRTFFDPV